MYFTGMLDFSTMKEWQIPGIIILLVDVQGIIRDVSREPEHFLIFTRNEIIGRRLNKVLRPITQATEPFMNPCAVPYKGFVPDELYVQVRHPSIASSDFSLFLYSFTPAFFKGKHRCALVFLARQTNNAPLTKKFMAIYRSENIPIIILDNGNIFTSIYGHKFFSQGSIIGLASKKNQCATVFPFKKGRSEGI